MMRIFLTGANGFLGSHLAAEISKHPKYCLTSTTRGGKPTLFGRSISVGDLSSETDWSEAIISHDIVIHTAARAHVMRDEALDPLEEYRRVNVQGTLRLAGQAAENNIRRFIFISSIKANGEATLAGKPYQADDKPTPEDPYGLSKLEAELGLMQIAAESGMEVVIIRPPLIYGPGVKGNFATMVKLVGKGVPLPLGAVQNKRSLVGIDNLIDLIIHCTDHPQAANQIFLVSDGEDLSTTELLRGVGKAMGKPARLISVPSVFLQFGASLLGKKAVAQRLFGSLQVDISKTCELLDWKPPYSVEEGLRRCFEHSQ